MAERETLQQHDHDLWLSTSPGHSWGDRIDLVIAAAARDGAVLDMDMVVLPACWFCR
jgi:hypothetical protein